MLGMVIGDIACSQLSHKKWENGGNLFPEGGKITEYTHVMLTAAEAVMAAEQLDPNISGSRSDVYAHMLGRLMARSLDAIRYTCRGGQGGISLVAVPAGFCADSARDADEIAEALVSEWHKTESGIKCAQAVAAAVYMARAGYLKSEIRDRIADDYYPAFYSSGTLGYEPFSLTRQEDVPRAIRCFLETSSFECAVRKAISLGDGSYAPIAGAIAEAYYGVPETLKADVLPFLEEDQRRTLEQWDEFIGNTSSAFHLLTKYIGRLMPVRRTCTDMQPVVDNTRRITTEFDSDLYSFALSNPRYHLAHDPTSALDNGIRRVKLAANALDTGEMDEQMVLELLMDSIHLYRAGEGDLFADGHVLALLKRLKDIERKTSPGVLSEACLRVGGYGGWNCRRLLFLNDGALLLDGRFRKQERVMHRFSLRNAVLLADKWEHLGVDCWRASYMQDDANMVLDGTQWSLYVRYRCARGFTISGNNVFPENWDALRAWFGMDVIGPDDRLPDDEDPEDDIWEDDSEVLTRQPGEFIFCSVAFNEGGCTYYYLTEDENIKVGDRIIVPVGPDNASRSAVVEEVEYFTTACVPYPLDKIKRIIGKTNDA